MDDATTKLYEPSPTKTLFVAFLNNVLGRVPLFPLFLAGNASSFSLLWIRGGTIRASACAPTLSRGASSGGRPPPGGELLQWYPVTGARSAFGDPSRDPP